MMSIVSLIPGSLLSSFLPFLFLLYRDGPYESNFEIEGTLSP